MRLSKLQPQSGLPGKPVDHNLGTHCFKDVLLWGIVHHYVCLTVVRQAALHMISNPSQICGCFFVSRDSFLWVSLEWKLYYVGVFGSCWGPVFWQTPIYVHPKDVCMWRSSRDSEPASIYTYVCTRKSHVHHHSSEPQNVDPLTLSLQSLESDCC